PGSQRPWEPGMRRQSARGTITPAKSSPATRTAGQRPRRLATAARLDDERVADRTVRAAHRATRRAGETEPSRREPTRSTEDPPRWGRPSPAAENRPAPQEDPAESPQIHPRYPRTSRAAARTHL